jgi:membrane-bound lytic murein transglycosylase D
MLMPFSTFSYADSDPLVETEAAMITSIDTQINNAQSVIRLEKQEDDLWARVRQGYGIPDLNNALVDSQLNWYSARSAYILRTTTRASLYLYHVVEELEKRGMPSELALLPFIESAFNPQAVSSAKASGMWQFIPSTGRDFDLKQNMFKDERRGVLDSTDAALSYLQKLYDMFGDWQLALAAYNWGEGSVQRAIKKQEAAGLPIDFNSMSYLMPKETQNYVPKLQAVKNIINHPELFNIELPQVKNEPYFLVVDKTRDIDVKIAAQLAELTVTEFKKLNPQFNRPIITGDADTKILLPAENLEIFQSNLDKWKGPLSTWAAYTVPKNERVESIARRVGAEVSLIREVNQIPANMLVKAGSTLLVPRSAQKEHSDISQQIVDHAILTLARASVSKRNRKSSFTLAARSTATKSVSKRIATNPFAKTLTTKSTLVSKRAKKMSVAQFKAREPSF